MWVWRACHRQWRSRQCRTLQKCSWPMLGDSNGMPTQKYFVLSELSLRYLHHDGRHETEPPGGPHPPRAAMEGQEGGVCQHQLLVCSSSLVLVSKRSWISLSQVSDSIDLSCQLKHMARLWTVTNRHLSLVFKMWSWISPWDLLLAPHFYCFVP